MLDRFRVTHPEGFHCANHQKIERICVNPECQKPSLLCGDVDCSKCRGNDGEAHIDCLSVDLKSVTSQLNKRADKQKSFAKHMLDIDSQLIRQLQRSR